MKNVTLIRGREFEHDHHDEVENRNKQLAMFARDCHLKLPTSLHWVWVSVVAYIGLNCFYYLLLVYYVVFIVFFSYNQNRLSHVYVLSLV